MNQTKNIETGPSQYYIYSCFVLVSHCVFSVAFVGGPTQPPTPAPTFYPIMPRVEPSPTTSPPTLPSHFANDGELPAAVKKYCNGSVDEKEAGIRTLLNLGHTFGHAIETASGYGVWLHGETVAMGMVMAADLSMRLGWIEQTDAAKIRAVLEQNFSMPVVPPADIEIEQYLDLMSSDKKAELGKPRFVLYKAIGEAVVAGDIESQMLEQTLTAGENLCR
mgnify:CR=1 FL=1